MHLQTKTVIPVIEENEVPLSPVSNIVPVNLTNAFLATYTELDKKAESNTSLEKNKRTKNKYIIHDIAEEALQTYRTRVLANDKLIYNDVDVLDFIYSKEIEKGPLSIGVINLYNAECTKHIPQDFKQFVLMSKLLILLKDEALINLWLIVMRTFYNSWINSTTYLI